MKYVSLITAACLCLGIFVGYAASQQSVDITTLPFSPAREANSTLYVSGQIPVTPDGQPVTAGIAEQTRQTMENIGRVLADNGYTFDDVVSVTVYLSDMEHYAAMNAAYRDFFKGTFPARACVGGLQIALGLDVEISAIAAK